MAKPKKIGEHGPIGSYPQVLGVGAGATGKPGHGIGEDSPGQSGYKAKPDQPKLIVKTSGKPKGKAAGRSRPQPRGGGKATVRRGSNARPRAGT